MHCEAEGKIIEELPKKGGTSKNGKDWEKREFVMETSTWYHSKMKFSMYSFDGPIEQCPRVGDKVKVKFEVEAREHNGNWYNDIKAINIEKL